MNQGSQPLAYLITWRTYGSWLHGEVDSVDRRHNTPGQPFRGRNDRLVERERKQMRSPAMVLSQAQRTVVADAIAETTRARGWTLLAGNVRTNHVHVVVAADIEPEPVMTTLKAWSTRRMREAGLLGPDARTWARHGSTRYLKTPESVERAIYYVNELQDEPREKPV